MSWRAATSPSCMESRAVGAAASRQYQKELEEFNLFLAQKRVDIKDQEALDLSLTLDLNQMFGAGYQSYGGDRLMAAWLHHHSEYGRNGSLKLPRSWRAMRGFRKLTPGKSRKAMPLAVWAAIAAEITRTNHLRMAVFLLLSVSTYARPSELLRARVFSLVRPVPGVARCWSLLLSPEEREERTKTGEFDTSLMLDSTWMTEWISPILECLKKNNPESPLWDFDYTAYHRVFRDIVQKFQLDMTPYMSRHSGPSIDRARNFRSQHEVQKRGQWKAQKSIMRYEKSARLAAQWESLPQPFRLQTLGRCCWGEKTFQFTPEEGSRQPICFGSFCR